MVPPTNVAPFPDLVELVFGRATARMVNGVELKGAPNPEGSTNTFGLVSGTLAAPKLAPIGTLPAGPFRPVLVPGAQPAAPFSPPSPTAGLYIILGGLLLAVVPQLLIGDGPAPNEDLLTYWMRHQQPAGDPIPQRTEAEERAAQLQLLEEEAARLQRNGEEDLARAAEQTLHGLRQRMAGSTANPSASQSHTSAHPTIVASAEGKTPPKGTRGPEGTQTEEAPEGAAPRHRFPLQVGDAREIFPWMELARLPGFNGAVIFRWQDERGLLMPMRPSSLGDKRHIYQILSDAGITITTAPQGTYGVRVGQTKETVRLQRGSIDVGLTEPNNDYAIQEGDRLLVGPTEFIFHPPTPKARLGELDHPPLPWKEWVAYFSGTPVAPEINSKTADPQYRFDPLHLLNKLLNEYAAAGRLGEEEARQVLARLYAYLRYEALGGRLQDSVAGAAEELLTLKGLRPTYSYGTILDSMRVEASPAHGDSASDVAGPVARAPAEPGRLSVSEGLRWHLERFFPKGGQSVAAIGETLTNMEQTLALDRPEPTHPSPNGTRPGSGLRAAYAEYKQIDPNRTRILGDESARVWTDRLIEELSRRGLERAILPRAGWLWVGNYPGEGEEIGRFYLSVYHPHAADVMEALFFMKQDAAELEFPLLAKMAHDLNDLHRADAAVVYFRAANQEAVYDLITALATGHPDWFKKSIPLFAAPLFDREGNRIKGVGFGQNSMYSEVESFGSKRAGPVTKAREAVQALPVGGYLTKEEVMEIMAYYLDRAGVDVENPAFNTGGRSLFPFIYHHTAAHKEAPEPTRPFDKSELKR